MKGAVVNLCKDDVRRCRFGRRRGPEKNDAIRMPKDAIRIAIFKSSQLFKIAEGQAPKQSSLMKWSEKHDIFLLFMKPISSRREAHKVDTNGKILRVTFAKKRRLPSVSTKSLSGIDTGCYQKKQKKKKKRASEGSSGSNTDETELDQLLK
ncbi:hypothetical protein P5673_026810, partial [Acropora cervicornis]